MASEVEICNSALIKLGDDTITSLTDDSKRARLCNAQFARLRDEVLRAHPWNFAIRRASLAKLSQAPAFEFAAAFQLPEDPYCLRVLLLFDGSAAQGISRHRWKIEGRTLLSDENSAKIIYIARVIDPNQFDAMFAEALALRLANELAYSLTNNATLVQTHYDLYRHALQQARATDASEGVPDFVIADEWTTARFQ